MERVFDSFCTHTSAPERFIEAQHELTHKFKESTKELYDISRDNGLEQIDSALPELIIQKFDDEQIWQELELQSGPSMQELVDVVSKLSATKELTFETVDKNKKSSTKVTQSDELDEEEENEDDMNVEDDEGDNFGLDESDELVERKGFDNVIDSDASDEERELEALLQKAQSMPHDDDDDDDEEEEENDDEEQDDDDPEFDFETSKKSKESGSLSGSQKRTKSIVDDKFFSLSDMAVFLEQEDAREERRIRREEKGAEAEESSDEDDDEDLDLDEEDEDESGANIKYSEFFDPPPNAESAAGMKKSVSFDVEEAENEDEDAGDEDDESNEEGDEEMEEEGVEGMNKDLFHDSDEGEELSEIFGGAKSSFERRQFRLKKKIKEMEVTSLADKPWQLKGEIAAGDRPENSLLQEDLDFDSNAKAAPVITEETTKSLEDIIKQRIKDKAWDDVERKEKKADDVFEFKKKVVLDQEKSKMSLSQVYEDEYIKQQEAEEEEQDDPKHESIQKSMQTLFIKLDALSNFHYAPKPAAPDIKIISNLPSISMEEALPVAASEATTLAPEEIKVKKKEELKGDTEKSKTDKMRDRRKKKNRQGAYYEIKEKKAKKIANINPNSSIAKKKAAGDVKKLAKTSTNVSLMKEKEQGSLTSSSQFFSQLQDQVSSHIASKKALKVSKDIDKNKKSSAKLKL